MGSSNPHLLLPTALPAASLRQYPAWMEGLDAGERPQWLEQEPNYWKMLKGWATAFPSRPGSLLKMAARAVAEQLLMGVTLTRVRTLLSSAHQRYRSFASSGREAMRTWGRHAGLLGSMQRHCALTLLSVAMPCNLAMGCNGCPADITGSWPIGC
jgi:hypothetical protein